jgi:predicted membrane protein
MSMKNDISSEKALETNGILALACLIIGIAFQKMILIYSAVLLLFAGLFLKKISLKIARSWLKIAELIGILNTKLILTFIFFAILTPVAFLYRFFYGDFMCLKRRSLNNKSYWKIREHTLKTDTFEKMW